MRAGLLATLISAGISTAALAAPTIDQSQLDFGTAISSLGQPLAQSFQAGAPNVAGAGVFIGNASPGASTTLTISLWDALPNAAGAAALAMASGVAANGQWVDVFFAPVPVTAGQTYYLVFSGGSSPFAIMGSISNPYGGGQVFAGASYDGFVNYDFAFRTYTDVPGVPEPATTLLFALGLAALGVAVRGREGHEPHRLPQRPRDRQDRSGSSK